MKSFALYRLPVTGYHISLENLDYSQFKSIFLNTLNNNAHIIKMFRLNKHSFMSKPCIQILKTNIPTKYCPWGKIVKLYKTTDLI